MSSQELPQIALVTGGSYGLGAEVSRHLGRSGAHVVVNHRQRGERAASVVAEIERSGGRASAMAADLADAAAVTAMIEDIKRRFGRLDILVLNASVVTAGGAGHTGAAAGRHLVESALPLMPAGSRIVFVTSNQAHFYPAKGVLKGYQPVAESKRAEETTLYAMRAAFNRRGVHCTVVSGDFVDQIDGAINIVSLFPAHDPAIPQFAAAVAKAAVSPVPSSIVYVGRTSAVERPAVLPEIEDDFDGWLADRIRPTRAYANVG
ncbi:MAG: SDR family oxidoreductase [Mycolicibacterium insubricum]|nr:SDR family oxidoreductase [Mycobacterium sp.]